MKNRVTLLMEDEPYKALRVMSAIENKSMSLLVEEFVMGDRANISDPEGIDMEEKQHDIEPDEERTQDFHFCEWEYVANPSTCRELAVGPFAIPDDWQKWGKDVVWLCSPHLKEMRAKV